jgi:molybdate-binding protein/DNA-binding XRE family transcriptional regulator
MSSHRLTNAVKAQRLERGWSQAELARRASISRTAVSAIEMRRLAPSVTAALALAEAFGCSVEALFAPWAAVARRASWAWAPAREACRYWEADVGGRRLRYPVESTAAGEIAHDGVWRESACREHPQAEPEKTLVVACCDPAAALLASQYARASGYRLIALQRSSRDSLRLLAQGLVHAAGIHLSSGADPAGNRSAVREQLTGAACLLGVAHWQEGVALVPTSKTRSVRAALRARLVWVGREPGSGARRCLDELSGNRLRPRRLAYDHRGVAEAIRCGWAEAGVCVQLAGEEAGLNFLPVRQEAYDLCFPAAWEGDPRLTALVRVVRSAAYRQLLGELPGYDVRQSGELQRVGGKR